MRDIVAVCRSRKRSRPDVATVLDRYLLRIGDRTWRGRASNACLDRMSRELRAKATRSTAVAVHDIGSGAASRKPLFRVGRKDAFHDYGAVPISSHPSSFARGSTRGRRVSAQASILVLAALYHDIGKATKSFQDMIQFSMSARRGKVREPEPVRHELISALVWDRIAGSRDDKALLARLADLDGAGLDEAFIEAGTQARRLHADAALRKGEVSLDLEFWKNPKSIAYAVGSLILTHHRLPSGNSGYRAFLSSEHVRPTRPASDAFDVADGTRYWHEDWFWKRHRNSVSKLEPGDATDVTDMTLRASLVAADHIASFRKTISSKFRSPIHLANTTGKPPKPADTLGDHVGKVVEAVPSAFHAIHDLRLRYPSLSEDEIPFPILYPRSEDPRFRWQAEASDRVREICARNEGGLFGCIVAGTGTGKTRGAPSILCAAALSDAVPERRSFRMTLALGLRSLTTQSGREYVGSLGFPSAAVSVVVGNPPIEFPEQQEDQDTPEGTEPDDTDRMPEWLKVERIRGSPPEPGTPAEADWIRTLSRQVDHDLPAFASLLAETAGARRTDILRLLASPIVIATIDHLMDVASPLRARFATSAYRIASSDLVLDEIDQHSPEDIAAICRLVFQAGSSGRRVLIMSATLPRPVADMMERAYRSGWESYARLVDADPGINCFCVSDTPGSFRFSHGRSGFLEAYTGCMSHTRTDLLARRPLRIARLTGAYDDWRGMIREIDRSCNEMHHDNHVEIDGRRVSIGLVRLTRVSHTTAVYTQLPEAINDGVRLRVCLHSRFPRVHRAWIENALRRLLDRKGNDHADRLMRTLEEMGISSRDDFRQARNVQIVVVTSPVVETGNDLDFDYAIVDPSSVRSIVQTAGRVYRHRTTPRDCVNVHILFRSPIVMQAGKLAMPGVETTPPSGMGIEPVWIETPDRSAASLLDGSSLRMDALLVVDDEYACPLSTAEARLLSRTIEPDRNSMLGSYFEDVRARMNAGPFRHRRFRRQTATDAFVAPTMAHGVPVWTIDRLPGTRASSAEPLGSDLQVSETTAVGYLFPDLFLRSLRDAGIDVGRDEGTIDELGVSIPIYQPMMATPVMSYRTDTGISFGCQKDLFRAFGKG